MNAWQNIYSSFDVVAFSIFGFNIYWYSLMYILALFSGLFIGKYFAKKYNFSMSSLMLDSYFIWVEIGVILGARLGYILIYDDNTLWYLSHPWQIFNPFNAQGEFVGIRGMSFHGAVIGFFVASILFCKKYKANLWEYLDLTALSVPLAYTFGRIGNFLNQELFGRATDVPWGIYVNGVLRHPSQLYEAFFEGICVFILIFIARKFQKFKGELIILYIAFYSLARFVCEFYREPDAHIGFLSFGLTMGQILSLVLVFLSFSIFSYLRLKRKA